MVDQAVKEERVRAAEAAAHRDNGVEAGGDGLDPAGPIRPEPHQDPRQHQRQDQRQDQRPVEALDRPVGVPAFCAIVRGERRVALGLEAYARIDAGRARLEQAIAERRVVYGVTTGFGPLADRLTAPDAIETLQRNLVHHLASGVGRPLSWASARSAALARLCSLALGYSGASRGAVDRLAAILNSDLAPMIPEKGTVGASGDLTPLAHLTLCLMGQGPWIDRDGGRVSPADGLARIGAAPLSLSARDGLALVNGVSAMTGQAALNAEASERLAAWSEALTAMQAELLAGRAEAWSAALCRARPHPGQGAAAAAMRDRLAGSERVVSGRAAERILPTDFSGSHEPAAPQDPYSLRCAPQVIGAARDALRWHAEIVARELGSASDNPIFTAEAPYALHGGNFFGAHVALASDTLSNAVITLAGLSERRIARLTDEKRSGGLPPFLTGGAPGLNSGFMGAQVTATALVAEMRARAGAASIQSLPTNGDNQDVVSLGTIAARGAGERIVDAARVLAIELLAAAQALEIRTGQDPARRFSPSARGLAAFARATSAPLDEDRPLSDEIEAMATRVLRERPPEPGPLE